MSNLYNFFLSYLILSYLILSYLILSYLIDILIIPNMGHKCSCKD